MSEDVIFGMKLSSRYANLELQDMWHQVLVLSIRSDLTVADALLSKESHAVWPSVENLFTWWRIFAGGDRAVGSPALPELTQLTEVKDRLDSHLQLLPMY